MNALQLTALVVLVLVALGAGLLGLAWANDRLQRRTRRTATLQDNLDALGRSHVVQFIVTTAFGGFGAVVLYLYLGTGR